MALCKQPDCRNLALSSSPYCHPCRDDLLARCSHNYTLQKDGTHVRNHNGWTAQSRAQSDVDRGLALDSSNPQYVRGNRFLYRRTDPSP